MPNLNAEAIRSVLEGRTVVLESGMQVVIKDGKTTVDGSVKRLPGLRWQQLWTLFRDANPELAEELENNHDIVTSTPAPVSTESNVSSSSTSGSSNPRPRSVTTRVVDVAEKPNGVYYDNVTSEYIIRLTESQKDVFRNLDVEEIRAAGYEDGFNQFMETMNKTEVGEEQCRMTPKVMNDITESLRKTSYSNRSKTAVVRRLETGLEHFARINDNVGI